MAILNSRNLRILLLEIVLAVLIFFVVTAWLQRDMPTGEAPSFTQVTLANQLVQLPAQDERPLLLHFWASWCPVCRFEQDSIQQLSKDYRVITVAMQSGNDAEVMAYMQENNLDFPVINDPNGALAQRYAIRGVPTSFGIDKDNQIRFVASGYSSEWGLRFRMWRLED